MSKNVITPYANESGKILWRFILNKVRESTYEELTENFNKRMSVTEKGGRPYDYSPKEIADKTFEYFEEAIDKNIPLTITGLSMSIGLSRSGFLNLGKGLNQEFVCTIKKGRDIIEMFLEAQGHILPNPAWPIFALKNMGWSDKQIVKRQIITEISEEEKLEALERMNNFSE